MDVSLLLMILLTVCIISDEMILIGFTHFGQGHEKYVPHTSQ